MTAAVELNSMAVALAPMTVGCPKCKMWRGMYCQSSGGYCNSAVGFHTARQKLVANLSDEERQAAYFEMHAEQDLARAKSEAEMDRLKADPVWVAERDALWAAQRQAMADVDARLRAEERELSARCADYPFLGQRSHADGCDCRVSGTVSLIARPVEVSRGVLPVADLNAERARRRS